VTDGTVLVGRRLAALRRARDARGQHDNPASVAPPAVDRAALARQATDLAERLAGAVEGDRLRTDRGSFVRVAADPTPIPLERERLARLPDGPPADVPLVCLDTETTGLATGTGTVAFLVGLGTWRGDDFHQVQLLLPDQADEPAFLDALAAEIPADAWLVTYNGRSFDWPLLVTRFRMTRREVPTHAGHIDLLPFVRRIFRHRLSDARLQTVETELLGLDRGPDVAGWEIPGRYLDFLRGGDAGPLREVVRHNHEDVRSLARLLAHVDVALADPEGRTSAPSGDLAGLARAYRRIGRMEEALDCIDTALQIPPATSRMRPSWTAALTARIADRDNLLVERAHLLRRLGRHGDALVTWRDLAAGGGNLAGVAWVEVAKILEHRLRDPGGALEACAAASRIAERSRALGRPLAGLEADLGRRRRRLVRRVAARGGLAGPGALRTAQPPRIPIDRA
jgi:tetratricopeptide (TPR) repeat protein